MTKDILNDIKQLIKNIPASDYNTSHVLSLSEYKEQIMESITKYANTFGQNIARDVNIEGIIRSLNGRKTTLLIDLIFNIGAREIGIKIDNYAKDTSRDLLTHLMNNEREVIWIIWDRVQSPGFGKGYYEKRIIELSNFVELQIPNIVQIYKPFKTLVKITFEEWLLKNQKVADTIEANPWKIFPSNSFEDQFYFWLYQIKQETMTENQLPWSAYTKYWIRFSASASLTPWGHKNIDEIFVEFDRWWEQYYPSRFKYFEQFYDAQTNLPFSFEYYRLKYLKSDSQIYGAINGSNFSFEKFMDVIVSNENAIILRDIENVIRQRHNLPNVGEGWVSELVLYNFIKVKFSQESVENHAKPAFLGLQHYDIYFPKYRIAIEYQGAQHHKPIKFFGGEEAFKKNLERDKRKREISIKNKVELIEVLPDYKESKIISQIRKAIKTQCSLLGIVE